MAATALADPNATYLNCYGASITNGAYSSSISNPQGWFGNETIWLQEVVLQHEHLIPLVPRGVNAAFISPSQSLALGHATDLALFDAIMPEDYRDMTHLIIPVNDTADAYPAPAATQSGAQSGTSLDSSSRSHWSLLVVGVRDGIGTALHYRTGTALHYSPIQNYNDRNAKAIVSKLGELIHKPLTFTEVLTMPRLPEGSGWDSGPVVCAAMRVLFIDRLLRCDVNSSVGMDLKPKHVDPRTARADMIRSIQRLRNSAASVSARAQSFALQIPGQPSTAPASGQLTNEPPSSETESLQIMTSGASEMEFLQTVTFGESVDEDS